MAKDSTQTSTPEYSQAARRSMAEAFAAFKSNIQTGMPICILVCIYSYDPETRMAEVLPLVKYQYNDGGVKYLQLHTKSVQIRQVVHGGFCVDIPIYAGDTGWIISSDVDTNCVKEFADATAVREEDADATTMDAWPREPSKPDRHMFNSGFFIPDYFGKATKTKASAGGVQVGKDDLYIGTAVGEQGYDQSRSVAITMTREGKVTVANGNEAYVTIENGEVTIHARKVKVEGEIDLGDKVKMLGKTVTCSDEDGAFIGL